VPFDPRLISAIPIAVAKAAMETGVAARSRSRRLRQRALRPPRPDRLDLQRIYDRVRRQPKRIVFAEGEEEQVMRAAVSYVNQKLGTAILLGRDDIIKANARNGRHRSRPPGIEIINARMSAATPSMPTILYERLQRKGYLLRDASD
jgi:malate dehydrogenase (oxaloacetate-decarboxylating)(NADP+)